MAPFRGFSSKLGGSGRHWGDVDTYLDEIKIIAKGVSEGGFWRNISRTRYAARMKVNRIMYHIAITYPFTRPGLDKKCELCSTSAVLKSNDNARVVGSNRLLSLPLLTSTSCSQNYSLLPRLPCRHILQ